MSISKIITAACEFFDVEEAEILGPSRMAEACRARDIAILVIFRVQKAPNKSEIARIFNRDHTTICAAIDRAAESISTKEDAQSAYRTILQRANNLRRNPRVLSIPTDQMFPFYLPKLPTHVGTAPEAMRV